MQGILNVTPSYPARDNICMKCNIKDHFGKVCKTDGVKNEGQAWKPRKGRKLSKFGKHHGAEMWWSAAMDLNVDKILQDVVSSDKFSKLVHKLEYHQLELHPEMRKAMTFVIQCGLYWYTKLLFSINAASEIYQHKIHKILQRVPGFANISNDLIYMV